MPTIVLTGGGTAGHVIPHLALLPYLKKSFDRVYYIGREAGIERELAEKNGVAYRAVPAVKFSRGNPFKNLRLPFRLIAGKRAAIRILRELKPDVVFSKGGFVAVPVVLAAKKLGIPVVAHESDFSPGLANRFTAKYCKSVCATFPGAAKSFGPKGVFTGAPIRSELYRGDRLAALRKLGLPGKKPVLLITGGSSGAAAINAAVRAALPELLEKYEVIHLVGKGNLSSAQCTVHSPQLKDNAECRMHNAQCNGHFSHVKPVTGSPSKENSPAKKEKSVGEQIDKGLDNTSQFSILNSQLKGSGRNCELYRALEFSDDMAGLLAAADFVVSRAGSNTIFELLALKKPMLLIPLPKGVSRGDQVLNARYFQENGLARVLPQGALTPRGLVSAIEKLRAEKERRLAAMLAFPNIDGTQKIFNEIYSVFKER